MKNGKISDFNKHWYGAYASKEYHKTPLFWFDRSSLSKDNFNCVINNILPRKYIGSVKNTINTIRVPLFEYFGSQVEFIKFMISSALF